MAQQVLNFCKLMWFPISRACSIEKMYGIAFTANTSACRCSSYARELERVPLCVMSQKTHNHGNREDLHDYFHSSVVGS